MLLEPLWVKVIDAEGGTAAELTRLCRLQDQKNAADHSLAIIEKEASPDETRQHEQVCLCVCARARVCVCVGGGGILPSVLAQFNSHRWL